MLRPRPVEAGILPSNDMRRTAPLLKTTEHSPDMREWVPSTFSNFLREIEGLSGHCDGDDPLVLFRGHTNSDWFLDCTLVRSILLEGTAQEIGYPRHLCFHTRVVDALLAKFGGVWRPSRDAFQKERSDDIDPWYELMKRLQQYVEEDTSPPRGTFLVDWTVDRDVALYFATYEGKESARRLRQTAGAVWVCDPVPTGNVWQTRKLGELFALMQGDGFRLRAERTLPLILHPPKQTRMLRASNQMPVYFTQMDFRCDQADSWCSVESQSESAVFRKIILTDSVLRESVAHLEKRGVTEEHVYPE